MIWKLRGLRTPRRARRPALARPILEPLETRLAPSADVLSYDYGPGSTGVNANETVLSPITVVSGTFGKLATTPVDGFVYAEPLVEQNVPIGVSPGDSSANLVGTPGVYGVAFVATEHDSLYAINAVAGSGAILWKRSFTTANTDSTPGTNINNTLGASTISTIPSYEVSGTDIGAEVGITSTPVIDPASGTIYVMVTTKEIVGSTVHYVQRLHGINTSDGTDRLVPFSVGDSQVGNVNNTPIFVYGTGDGNVPDPNQASDGNPLGTIVQFNAMQELQRVALSLENGQIYAGWASYGDVSPYHGWVVSWTVSGGAFQPAGWFCTSPNDGASGVWMGGGALQFEADGSAFYFETGNGSGGAPNLNPQGFPSNANYNEALVKVVADPTTSINHQGPNGWGMKAADYFIPFNVVALDDADSDFGSGAPLLLPPSAGIPGHPNLMLAAGKEGTVYLIDRDNMGKFNPVNDNVLNAVNDGSGHREPPNLLPGSLSTPAYYNGKIYWISGYSGKAYSFQISSAGIVAPTSQTPITFGFEPGSIVVSAYGAIDGVVWVMDRDQTAIHAYDPSTFATELWNSNMATGDALDSVVKFAVPTVADGEVFVGTYDTLTIYGTAVDGFTPPSAPILQSATALSGGSSINLTWTDPTPSPNVATSYMIEESTDNVNFAPVANEPQGATSVAIGDLQPLTLYYFRIRGSNVVGTSPYSNTMSAATTALMPLLDFSGGFAGATGVLTLNGSAALNGSRLELTSDGASQTGSAFTTNLVDVGKFDTQFTFQLNPAGTSGDGFTFTIQGLGPTALGPGDAGLGYGGANGGITPSIALKFDLADSAGEGVDSTGLYLNGAAPTNIGSVDLSASGIDLHSGDVFQVSLGYNGALLVEMLTDTRTHASATYTWAVDIRGTLGVSRGYVGFTGSTGSLTATQDLLTWSYYPYAAYSPNAPTGLGATPASANSVALYWTSNSNIQTGYHLTRATDSGFTQNVITENLSPSINSFVDTAAGLAPGTTYYYHLTAFNGAGDSGTANVSSVTIPFAPPVPTSLQVIGVAPTEVDLSWTDHAGHQANDYVILRSIDGGSFTQVATLPPTSRTPPSTYEWSDTGLTPGNNYTYTVEAVNVSGNNGAATVSTSTLTEAPTNLNAVGGDGQVALSWTAAPGAASYNVYGGVKHLETLLTTVTGTTYTDTTPANGQVYDYYVTSLYSNLTPPGNESTPSSKVLAAPGALAADTINIPYTQTLTPTWGSGNQVLTVSNLSNPLPGVTVPTSGVGSLVLSGTPTAAGTESFTLTALDTDGTQVATNYQIVVNPGLSLSPAILPGDVGAPYAQTITAAGGTAGLSFSVSNVSGSLSGLTLPSGGLNSLNFTGTPTAAGTLTFTVTVVDAVGATASANYTLTVNPPLTLGPASLPQDTVSIPYNQTIAAVGGSPSVTLSVSNLAGAISGLTLSTTSGALTISGTPTSSGTESFTLTATDAIGSTVVIPYTIVVNPMVALSPFKLPPGTINVPYNQTITASGGSGTLSLAITGFTGAIPGLSIPTSTSPVISGTPTATGTETFTVTASDAVGASATITYTLTVSPTAPFLSLPASGFSAAVGTTLLNYPISINQLSDAAATRHVGLTSAVLVLTYPTGVFGFPTGANLTNYVSLGSIPLADSAGAGGANDWNLTATSPADGKLVINLSAKAGDAITADLGGGSLVTIDFPILSSAPLGPVPLTLINNSGGHTQIVGSNGTYVLSPAPPYTGSLTVSSGAPTQFLVTVASTVQAGRGFIVSVQAADAQGNPTLNYTGSAKATATVSPGGATGSFPSTVSLNSSGFGYFLASLPAAGSYTLSLAGGSLSGSAPVTVTPGPAVKLGFATSPASTSTGLALPPVSVQVLDAYGNIVTSDNTDQVTLNVASGPGSFTEASTPTARVVNGVATFNNLALVTPGSYQLSAAVPGLYTGPYSAAFDVLPLQIQPGSLLGTPSGFSLQFNVPILVNSVTPVLYGQGSGASAPVPAVRLTQVQDAGGNAVNIPVEGSVILNPATNSLTFLATNTAYEANTGEPVLPDGTYQVDLSATAGGFQAVDGGGLLDGLGTGAAGSGDYLATFTVTAAALRADVVWVPDTADGPGQALSAPGMNQAGGGYPIYLSDSSGLVTSVQVTLNYNPALLTVTGVSGTNFALLDTSSPGQAILQYSGPALPLGSQVPIGYLLATVPAGTPANPTPYKAKDLLDLSAVTLNAGSIPVVTSAGLHLLAYVGDANGDGSYTSQDAVLITRAALQLDSGFAAYPLVDPVIVADTDGSGFIPADAALQANEVGAGVATTNLANPPIPRGVVFQAIGNNVDPRLRLAISAQGSGASNSSMVTAAVNIDDPHPAGSTGLIEAHLALTYDPRRFTVSAADVQLGSVLSTAGGWQVAPTIDPLTGQIAIVLSSDAPVTTTGGGSLVTIDFHPLSSGPGALAAGAAGPGSPIALVASVNINGRYTATELEDAQGTFTLTPAPANALPASADRAALDQFFALTGAEPESGFDLGLTRGQ
jgi:fibronectin type 3 domain-containing protein